MHSQLVELVAGEEVKVCVKGPKESSPTDSLKTLLGNLPNAPSGACLHRCASADASSG